MKKLFKLSLIALLCSLAINAKAQLADVTYTVKLYSNNGIYSCEGCNGLACWETGDEEYTANAWFRDDVNGTATGVTCFTCNNNGDCYYGGGTTLGSRTNGAYRIDPLLQAWEDDGGSRCSFDGGDDCYLGQTDMGDVYFREGAFPSFSTYSSYGWFNSSSHSIAIDVTWKYSGTNSLITPTCATQTAAYSAGAIRSWSVYLTAGVTYNFNNCTSTSNDTYIRLYSSDGYTIVSSGDDNCGVLSSITYTPGSSGYYYLEISQYSRGALSAAGTLTYSIVPKTGATFSSPIVVGTLGCGSYSNSQSNVVNTGFCNDYGQTSDDIYYQFTLSSTATVNMSHCGSGFDTYMYLLNSGGTALYSNDDDGTVCSGSAASLQQSLAAGTYYLVSEGWSTSSGTINTQIGIQSPVGGSITGTTPVCPNQTGVTYSISGTTFATDYQWAVPSGASITAGQGTTSITVNWGSTAGNITCTPRTYGGACSGSAVSYPVTFNTVSVAPTSITGTITICNGSNTTLSLSGGTAGTGSTAQWFSGSCGGVSVGTGNSVTVAPTANTDYFVRYAGTCNTTTCATTTVTVRDASAAVASSTLASCADPSAPYAVLSATVPTVGSGTWSITSGSGTLASTTANPTTITGLSTTGTSTQVKWEVAYASAPTCPKSQTLTITPTSLASIGQVSLQSTGSPQYYNCRTCSVKDGKTYTYYDNVGKIIAKVVDPSGGGIEMGSTEVCTGYDYSTALVPTKPVSGDVKRVLTNYADQQPYLPRYWSINPTTKTGQSVTVTLYFTKAEYDALKANAASTAYAFNTAGELAMTKYPNGSAGAFTAPASAGGTNVPITIATYNSDYSVTFVVSSFSTFYIHPQRFPFAALPVEMTSFTGYNQQDKNVLNWTTASEKNSDKFEVEKSTDGVSWISIGWQKAVGGNTLTNYTFYDNQPIVGNNYYRLKIIDNDRTFTYSNTINVTVGVAMVNGIVKVFPSPTNGLVNIQLQSTKNVSLTLEISNLLGQKVVSRDITLQTGITLVNVDLSELSGGTYIVSYIDALGTRHQEKIIKQ